MAARFRILRLGLIAAAMLAIVGAVAADRAQPAPDGRLTVGIATFHAARGNPFRAVGTPGLYIWSAVYDALTEIRPGGHVGPALAESWERVSPLEWRFRLRPGIRFADGAPLDAGAVVASIGIVTADYSNTQVGALLAGVADIRAQGDRVVTITTHRPNAALPAELSGVFIVPAAAWREQGAERFAAQAYGTGPFRIVSSEPSRIDLAPNPTSWRQPHLTALSFIELPEEAARISALRSGAIDLAIQVSAETRPQLEASGIRIVSWRAPLVLTFAFWTEREDSPFRDVRVRQALNYAVDKQAIAELVLGDPSAAASQPASPAALGFDPSIEPYPYDPARARALLAEAGYPDGLDLVTEIAINAIPGDAVIYGAAAADLARVGVRLELRSLPVATWLKKFLTQGYRAPIFGLALAALPRGDALNAVRVVTCGKIPAPAYTCIRSLDPLLAAADEEGDPARREALLKALMRKAHDEAVSLFLINSIDFTAAAPRVSGYAPDTRFIHWELVSTGGNS